MISDVVMAEEDPPAPPAAPVPVTVDYGDDLGCGNGRRRSTSSTSSSSSGDGRGLGTSWGGGGSNNGGCANIRTSSSSRTTNSNTSGGAVCNTVGDDGLGDIRTAGSVGAVADTVCEVDVTAEASSIGGAATKGWSKTKHVGDAGLTTGWRTLKLSDSSEGECADGDHGCGLHLDDWYGEILSWEID